MSFLKLFEFFEVDFQHSTVSFTPTIRNLVFKGKGSEKQA